MCFTSARFIVAGSDRHPTKSPSPQKKPKGRTLLELARAFYTDPAAHRLVYAFNHAPDAFDFDELLRELGLLPSQQGEGGGDGEPAGSGGGGSGGRA